MGNDKRLIACVAVIAAALSQCAEKWPETPPPRPADSPPPPARRKLSYGEQRELAALPERIAALEREIAELEAAFADPTFYSRDPAGAADAAPPGTSPRRTRRRGDPLAGTLRAGVTVMRNLPEKQH